MNAGKLVILGLFGVTLAMSAFAIWYRQAAGRRSHAWLGVEHGQRIQWAEEIDLLRFPPRDTCEQPAADDPRWRSIKRVSGMTHLQGALMEDRSFVWDAPADAAKCTPQWEYILRFRDPQGATHLALDLECERIRLLEKSVKSPEAGQAGQSTPSAELSFSPMGTFLKRFITSQFPAEGPTGPGGDSPPSKKQTLIDDQNLEFFEIDAGSARVFWTRSHPVGKRRQPMCLLHELGLLPS